MKKPDFKRSDQKRDNVEKRSSIVGKPIERRQSLTQMMMDAVGLSGYKDRYFALDIGKRILTYYKDVKVDTPESGRIDMSRIVDIQISQLHDAPEFSLDLVSIDQHYTIAAKDSATMVRWAHAFNLVRARLPNQINGLVPARARGDSRLTAADTPAQKWSRYDVVYESAGPLMLNVVGTSNTDTQGNILNNWIIVASFENYTDGSPGRSEQVILFCSCVCEARMCKPCFV